MNELLGRAVGRDGWCVGRWGWGIGWLGLVLSGSVVVVVEHLALALVSVSPLELKGNIDFSIFVIGVNYLPWQLSR